MIKLASEKDLVEIRDLIKANNLPAEDISEHVHNFLILEKDHNVIGCIGIEIYNETGLMRSLAVIDSQKGNSFGQLLTQELISYSKSMGIARLYLITTTAEKFFEKFGFNSIPRENADEAIKNTTEYKYLCPESAVVMVREIYDNTE
jgi:amino-acid N-acetyltransferase